MANRPETNIDSSLIARLRSDSRGTVLVMLVVALSALVGMSALAIDLGMLVTARTQSQRAADSGALAGALVLADPHATADEAREEAKQFANKHNVLRLGADVEDGDVDVIMSEHKVRVRVEHTIPTLFARIFGVAEVSVSTVAAARAAPAAGVSCPLPVAMIDRWTDLDGDGEYDDGEPYTACGDDGGSCTGYTYQSGQGELIEVKTQPSQGGGNGNGNGGGDGNGGGGAVPRTCLAQDQPGWFCWIRPEDAPGSATVARDIVDGCDSWQLDVAIGEPVHAATGNMESVVQHVKNYIDNHDPDHHWDEGQDCVADGTGSCVDDSERIRGIPLIDPSTPNSGGNSVRATTSNLAGAFMEKVASAPDEPHGGGPSGEWNVYLRLVQDYAGGTGVGTGSSSGQLLKHIVLVE